MAQLTEWMFLYLVFIRILSFKPFRLRHGHWRQQNCCPGRKRKIKYVKAEAGLEVVPVATKIGCPARSIYRKAKQDRNSEQLPGKPLHGNSG